MSLVHKWLTESTSLVVLPLLSSIQTHQMEDLPLDHDHRHMIHFP